MKIFKRGFFDYDNLFTIIIIVMILLTNKTINALHKRDNLIQARIDVVESRCDVAGEMIDELWQEVFE